MILIGLKGRLHSGKDTAFEYIWEAAGPRVRVERAGFADKMKLSGVRALGFDPDTVEEAVRIADIIKDQCMVTVNLVGDTHPVLMATRDRGTMRATITGREFWQRYGTEAHREVFNSEFWVDALLPEPDPRPGGIFPEVASQVALTERFPGVDVLVITDARFPNEARRIVDLGGQMWVIDADRRLGPLPKDSHVSEHPLPPSIPTVRVPNNGSLEQFKCAVETAWNLGVTRGR